LVNLFEPYLVKFVAPYISVLTHVPSTNRSFSHYLNLSHILTL